MSNIPVILVKIDYRQIKYSKKSYFHTFVTVTNGVSIESVSKMLGHRSIKATQHYAKSLDRKVSDDMKALKENFKKKKTLVIYETKVI